MAIFSTNQAMQVYVATGTTPITVGKGKDYKYVKHINALGEAVRSDLIKNILWTSYVSADAAKIALAKFKVTLKAEVNGGAPVVGQDYILRVVIPQYSADHSQIKYGVVHVDASMNAEAFYKAMAESLTKNFARELTPMLTFEGSAEGITITEADPQWSRGLKPFATLGIMESHIQPDMIISEGEEVLWGKVESLEGKKVANSKKVADLEYFAMGERGDIYRGAGWPNVITTNYLVDPTDTTGYDVLTVHYAYTGPNEASQKSEKDLILIGKASDLAAAKGEFITK